ILERQRVRRALVERSAPGEILFCRAEKSLRRLHATHQSGWPVLQKRGAQRPRPAADVEPLLALGHRQPGKETRRDLPAPAADVLLVWIAALPGVRNSVVHGATVAVCAAGA